jgi:hypothetical protein
VCPDLHAVFDPLDPLDRNDGQVRKKSVKTLRITYRPRSLGLPPSRRRFHHEMCARTSFSEQVRGVSDEHRHHHVTLVSVAHAFVTLQRLDPKVRASA